MTSAVRLHAYGGPDELRYETVPTPEPAPTEALVEHEAIGVNYIDVYFRTGLYKAASLPATIGMEGAGIVRAVGNAVSGISVGDRVAYAGAIGAYATTRTIAADRLVRIPDGVSSDIAASIMLQGMTAEYLIRRTYPVKRGETILVHAAAGGVGLLLCQWAQHLGAEVIGVVSTEEKAALARENGASHVLIGLDGLADHVRDITGGRMLPVVYDSVGKDSFAASLDCLAPRGLMVLFGTSSGPPAPVEINLLAAKGSLYLTRPSLATYTAKRADLEASAQALFDVVASGAVVPRLQQRYALAEAAEAHRALEARRTTGSTILQP